MKKYTLLVIGLLTPVVILIFCVNITFSRLKIVPFYDDCNKVWGHRGYIKGLEMNSMESIQRAFELGAAGVELDILFIPEMERFLVAHNLPTSPKSESTLYLDELFEELGDKGYFWLDIKNLRELNRSDTVMAAETMFSLLSQHGLVNKTIIESKMASKLAIFADRKIFTSLWITPGRSDGWFDSRLKMFLYKSRFLRGGYSTVSMNYLNFTPYVQSYLENVPVHLFTINNLEEIKEYHHMPNVRIILSDEDHFSLDSCDE
jgi:hypothetical protein